MTKFEQARAAIYRAAVKNVKNHGKNQLLAARQYTDGVTYHCPRFDETRGMYEMSARETKSGQPFIVRW